jgi:hypothetical protein
LHLTVPTFTCSSILCKQRSVMSAAAHLDNVADHWQKIGHCFTRSWWGHRQASDRLSDRVSMIFPTLFSDSTLWRVDLDSKTPKDSQGLPRTPALSTPVVRNPSLQIERQVFIILYPQPICLVQVFIAKFVPLRKNVDISTGHGVYQFTIHIYPRLTQIVAEASLLFLRPQCCVALPALVGLKEPVPSISVVLETEVPLKH